MPYILICILTVFAPLASLADSRPLPTEFQSIDQIHNLIGTMLSQRMNTLLNQSQARATSPGQKIIRNTPHKLCYQQRPTGEADLLLDTQIEQQDNLLVITNTITMSGRCGLLTGETILRQAGIGISSPSQNSLFLSKLPTVSNTGLIELNYQVQRPYFQFVIDYSNIDLTRKWKYTLFREANNPTSGGLEVVIIESKNEIGSKYTRTYSIHKFAEDSSSIATTYKIVGLLAAETTDWYNYRFYIDERFYNIAIDDFTLLVTRSILGPLLSSI